MFEIEFFVEKGIIRKIETDFAGSPLDVIREEVLWKRNMWDTDIPRNTSERYLKTTLRCLYR